MCGSSMPVSTWPAGSTGQLARELPKPRTSKQNRSAPHEAVVAGFEHRVGLRIVAVGGHDEGTRTPGGGG